MSLKILQAYQKKTGKVWTVKDYYFNLAKLGGFLARKSDGNPGWQTLWEGQQQLYWMTEGAKILEELKNYG